MEARQSPSVLPTCIEEHETPSHENGNRAPYNTPFYPPAPADTRDGAGLDRGAVLLSTRTKRKKKCLQKYECLTKYELRLTRTWYQVCSYEPE